MNIKQHNITKHNISSEILFPLLYHQTTELSFSIMSFLYLDNYNNKLVNTKYYKLKEPNITYKLQ
jgi:hypothetical protein